jgi:hypothetical protein
MADSAMPEWTPPRPIDSSVNEMSRISAPESSKEFPK